MNSPVHMRLPWSSLVILRLSDDWRTAEAETATSTASNWTALSLTRADVDGLGEVETKPEAGVES